MTVPLHAKEREFGLALIADYSRKASEATDEKLRDEFVKKSQKIINDLRIGAEELTAQLHLTPEQFALLSPYAQV